MSLRSYIVLVLTLLGVQSGFAQRGFGTSSVNDPGNHLPKDRHVFTLPPDSHWYEQPWSDSTYLFPQFQEGRIELKNGYTPTRHLLMNYNLFFEVFMVKQENGDIFPFNHSSEIKYIWLGDHKFVYTLAHGYLEIIQQGKASLGEVSFMNGVVQLVSTSPKYGVNGSDRREGISKTPRYYWIEHNYYIFPDSSSRRLLRPSPAALPKIFKKEKSKIRSYEREHKTDYQKRQDLLDIVSYCNSEL